MERLVVDGFGKFVSCEGTNIVIREFSGSGGDRHKKTLHYVPVESLRQVIISGKGSISTDAINLLAKSQVDVVIIDSRGEVTAKVAPVEFRTVRTRREQYYAYNDSRSGYLAKKFIEGKAKNQYAYLGTLAKVRKDVHPDAANALISARERIRPLIDSIAAFPDAPIERIRNPLMGTEGMISDIYWKAVRNVIPPEFGFQERSGRNATDPVNAMLNYGYGILEGEVHRAIHLAGLDPYAGYLHADRPGSNTLAFDLMEEFRQQLVDKAVLAQVTRGVVKPSDFSLKEGTCRLDDAARRGLLQDVLGKFEEYTTMGDEKVRWCDLIVSQARAVAKYLRGEASSYEPYYLRW